MILLVALVAMPSVAMAQGVSAAPGGDGGLTVDFDYMTRGEIRDGGLVVKVEEEVDDFAAFLLERSRLALSYQGRGVSIRMTPQHSGTWGGLGGGTLGMYEAWVQFGSENKGFFTRIGRQDLSYDDQRIFGSDDFSMTGKSHDVLKAGYEGHGHKFHIFGAFNQNESNMDGGTYFTGGYQPYKAMEAAWYHYDFSRFPLGVSLLFINLGMQGNDVSKDGPRTYQQQMAGTFLSFKPEKWGIEAAYYRQFGESEYGIPIEAWMASVKATASLGKHFGLYGGYDYLSGDEYFAVPPQGKVGMVQHEKIRGFSSVYGSHHKFYGAMDFFYVTTYYHGFTPGLQNAYLGAKWTPSEKLTFDASFHSMYIATVLQDAGQGLGHELELSAGYNIRKDLSLSAGYSYMRGSETMVLLKRTSESRQLQWGWVMLTYSPRVLNSLK